MPLLFGLAIAGYPLISFLPVVLGIDSRAVSVPYRAFVVIASSVLFYRCGLATGRFYRGLFWLPLSIFWGLYFFRLFLDTALVPTGLRLHPSEYLMFAVGVSFLPMLPFFIHTSARTRQRALALTLAMAGTAVSLGLSTALLSLLSGDTSVLERGRLAIATLNPISFGHLGASMVLLAAAALLSARTNTFRGSLALLSVVGLGLGVTVLSGSRGPLLALFVGLAVLFLSALRRDMQLRVVVVGVVLLVGGFYGGTIIQERLGFGVLTRFQESGAQLTGQSSLERLQLMRDTWQQVLEHPLVGSGLEERNSHSYPHNVVLESFMATGVLGGSMFVTLLIMSVIATWSVVRRQRQSAWIAALYSQYLIGAQVSGSLYGSSAMWIVMASIVTIASSGGSPGRHPDAADPDPQESK